MQRVEHVDQRKPGSVLGGLLVDVDEFVEIVPQAQSDAGVAHTFIARQHEP